MGASSSALKEPAAKDIFSSAVGTRNKRGTARRPAHRMKVPCIQQRTVEQGPWAVVIAGLTGTAICLRARQMFEAGTHLSVALPNEQGKPNLLRVARCAESTAAAEWILVGTFVKELAPEVVDSVQA